LATSIEKTRGRTVIPRLLCVSALALAALLPGCGGGNDESALESTGPADGAYADRANAVCARALVETRRLGRRFSQSGEVTADPLTLTTEGLIKPGIAIQERLASRLRALGPPQEGAASVRAYLELFDPLDALSRQRLRVGQAGDLDEAQRLERLMQEVGREQQEAATTAGLDTCATDFVGAAFATGASN
jgi:hypothetical protein